MAGDSKIVLCNLCAARGCSTEKGLACARACFLLCAYGAEILQPSAPLPERKKDGPDLRPLQCRMARINVFARVASEHASPFAVAAGAQHCTIVGFSPTPAHYSTPAKATFWPFWPFLPFRARVTIS
jgi:hypothetical protein